MAKTKISEFSATPGNNTDIDGINLAEGCAPSGINDAIRELMAQLKDFQAGTAGDSFNGPVGTTTAAAGAFTTLTTSGAVTHNGGTANGVAYLNGSKVLTTGSALTFDGSQFYVNGGASGIPLTLNNNTGSNTNLAFTEGGTAKWYLRNIAGNGGFSFYDVNAGSEQMRLTSTGLGIGTSSPGYKLSVATTSDHVGLYDTDITGLVHVLSGNGNSSLYIGADNGNVAASSNLIFGVDGTERARITSGGDLLVGKTSTDTGVVGAALLPTASAGFIASFTSDGQRAVIANRLSSDGDLYSMRRSGTEVGTISVTTTATAYNTSSDYRLKDNPQPLTGSGAFIDALKPKTWDWKSGGKGVGFIAHEVQDVSPGSVVGEKDAVDTEGKPIMQAMEYGSAEFIANIIAELQSLRARVAALEAA